MYLFKCIRRILSRNFLAVNVLTSPKNSWNLHKSTFILFFDHIEPNWVRKSIMESGVRFEDCLLTRWVSTTSILVVIERIYRYQLKSNYWKNHTIFAAFFLQFWYLNQISNVLNRKMSLIGQGFLKLLTPKFVPI